MDIKREILCPCDLQGRKAIKLVQSVSFQLREQVYFLKNKHLVNINSLLGLLSLGIKENDKITIMTKTEIGLECVLSILNSIARQ